MRENEHQNIRKTQKKLASVTMRMRECGGDPDLVLNNMRHFSYSQKKTYAFNEFRRKTKKNLYSGTY